VPSSSYAYLGGISHPYYLNKPPNSVAGFSELGRAWKSRPSHIYVAVLSQCMDSA